MISPSFSTGDQALVTDNFVHSLDAATLHIAVYDCFVWEIRDIAVVHDSLATHSEDIRKMRECVTEAFISTHRQDLLAKYHKHFAEMLDNGEKLPLPRDRGDLNINDVRKSLYAFD